MYKLSADLLVEVDETLRAVDVVECCKARDGPVDGHGVGSKLAPAGQQKPVRVRPGNEDALVSCDVAKVAQLIPEICYTFWSFGPGR